MLTNDEARALAVLSSIVALGAVLSWVDARHPQFLRLTLGDSLALGSTRHESLDPEPAPAKPAPPAPFAFTESTHVATADSAGSYSLDGRLELNKATAEELEALPGIGPKTAERIVEDRAKRGRCRSAKDLSRVKGIGPKTMVRLLPLIVVAPAPPGAKAAKAAKAATTPPRPDSGR